MTTNHHTPIAAGATGDESTINTPLSDLDTGITNASDGTAAITPDIDGGTIDGATVGANTASSGAFTTLSATGAMSWGQMFNANLNNSPQTITTNTLTKIQWQSAGYDESSILDLATNYEAVFTQTGYYLIYARIYWSSWVANSLGELYIYIGGSGASYVVDYPNSGNGWSQQIMTFPNYITSSTTLDVRVKQVTGGNVDVNGATNLTTFSCMRVK